MMYSYMYYPDYLYHHGAKGQKWGVRRFQNRDGSLTSAGERHRDQIDGTTSKSAGGRRSLSSRYHSRAARKIQRDADKLRRAGLHKEADAVQQVADKHAAKAARGGSSGRLKKVLGTTLGVAAAAGAGYLGGKYIGKKLVNSGKITPEKYHNVINRLKDLPGKAKYGAGYAQGTASRLGKSAREGVNKAVLNVGGRAMGAYGRAKTGLSRLGGSASNLASKYGAQAKNFAKAGLSKAKYGAGYAQGTASRLGKSAGRTIANNAKILGYNAQGKYYDARTALSGSNAYRKLRTAASIAGDKATRLGARATTSAIYRSQQAGNAVRGLANRASNSTAGSRARILGETARGLASGAKERYYRRKMRRYS